MDLILVFCDIDLFEVIKLLSFLFVNVHNLSLRICTLLSSDCALLKIKGLSSARIAQAKGYFFTRPELGCLIVVTHVSINLVRDRMIDHLIAIVCHTLLVDVYL